MNDRQFARAHGEYPSPDRHGFWDSGEEDASMPEEAEGQDDPALDSATSADVPDNARTVIDTTTVDPFTLPYVLMSEMKHLPKCAGIYFAIEQDEVVYIGKSGNVYHRWKNHQLRGVICDMSDLKAVRRFRLSWLAVDDLRSLTDIERELIRRFRPRLNHVHNNPAVPIPGSESTVEALDRAETYLTANERAVPADILATLRRVLAAYKADRPKVLAEALAEIGRRGGIVKSEAKKEGARNARKAPGSGRQRLPEDQIRPASVARREKREEERLRRQTAGGVTNA
jgi:hypothetical protein